MKKTAQCILLFVSLILLSTVPVQKVCGDQEKVEVVLQASADTYADQKHPDSSYGSSELLRVRSLESGNARMYVLFNVSTIPPGATVLSAKLFLYLLEPPTSNRTYVCYHLNSAWDEDSLTWNKRPQSISTYASSSQVTTARGWVVWDVKDQIQKLLYGIEEYAWDNFGFEIFDKFEGSSEPEEAAFCAKEFAETDMRPFLTIEFIPPKLNLTVSSLFLDPEDWVYLKIKRLSQDGIVVIRADRSVKQDWISFGPITVRLYTSSETGVFSLRPGGEPIDKAVIGNGETEIDIYYHDTSPGVHMLSIAVEGYPSGYYVGSSVQITVRTDDSPPQIINIFVSPENPAMGDLIKVSALITDIGSGVKEAALYYSTDGGVSWTKLLMNFLGDRYETYIPGQNAFTEVSYYVEAIDKNGNTAKTDIDKISIGPPGWMYGAIVMLVIATFLFGFMYVKRRRSRRIVD